jgi:hypothetical protein
MKVSLGATAIVHEGLMTERTRENTDLVIRMADRSARSSYFASLGSASSGSRVYRSGNLYP